jgi:transposase
MNEKIDSGSSESSRLEALYRKATDPVLRTHLLMVWRISLGDSVGEVARMVGYSQKWTREIAKRYESEGVEGLGDRRHGNPGAKERALLDEEGQGRLREALLKEAPPGGGMWSGPKVARWIEQRRERLEEGSCPTGLGVSEEGAYEPSGSQALERPGSRLRRARSFQKSLPERLREIRKAYPGAQEVELWAEDEARLGLKPVMRRVWAPVGKRPVARFKRGYEWTYLYGFVRPESGEVYWLILPTVNTELFSMALYEFAREVAVGKDKRVLLVVDRAGWHTGGEVEVPEGIHLEFLPSGSPELQPAERLWPLTNEAVANGLFEEIEEIEEALVERCLELLDQPETIKGLTNYHWWPQAA